MNSNSHEPDNCLSRRDFLLAGAGSAVALLLVTMPGAAFGAEIAKLRVASYPRKHVGKLSALKPGEPLNFTYPFDDPRCGSSLYKLGTPAGGGVGPDRDVVAFNLLCPHQGMTLAGAFEVKHKLAGPCPLHLTTFDLTRHGMVVAGHATESLPQVALVVEGDDIYATAVMGLIYGYSSNLPRA